MAIAFAAKLDVYEDGTPGKINFRDISNYSSNTDGITSDTPTNRSVQIKDSDGNIVATVQLTLQTDGSYGGSYIFSEDKYCQYNFTITLPGNVLKNSTTNYVSVGFYNAIFSQIMAEKAGDCGCSSGKLCTNLTWAMHSKNAAIIHADKAMGALSQQEITAANQFLNDTSNC